MVFLVTRCKISYAVCMRPEDLRDLLRRQPFVPVKIHLSDGTTYEVRHPEMAIIGRSTATIGVEKQEGSGIADRLMYRSLLHIVRVEDANGRAASPQ
ncbi:MAG: hypothetical protein ACUVXJ_12515 [Phycisphaerae bacterium]